MPHKFFSMKSSFDKFNSPSAEFSNRQLRSSIWYANHRAQLRRIFYGASITIVAILAVYGLVGWGYYFAVNYNADRRLLGLSAAQFADYEAKHSVTGAVPFTVGPLAVYSQATGKYDFVVLIKNPNPRHAVSITYSFSYAGGQTASQTTTVLPLNSKPLTVFGQSMGEFPASAHFNVEQVNWQYLDSHEYPDLAEFISSRQQFLVEKLTFRRRDPAAGIFADSIMFSLINDSVYGYVAPRFLAVMLNGDSVVGVFPISFANLPAHAVENVDLRSFGDITGVSEVQLYPDIAVLDPAAFLPPAR